MVIEKKSEVVEYDYRVVSTDGRFVRYLGANATEEQKKIAVNDVKDYEASARGVIMSRLLDTGVLQKVPSPKAQYKEENGTQVALSWAECEKDIYLRKMALYAIDQIVDGSGDRTDYFIFTPASEDNIQDLMILAKLNHACCPEMTTWNKDKWPEHMFLQADSIEVGKNYIVAINDECERWEAYEFDHMLSQFKKMTEYFSDMAKAQRKALKK
jgi:hypothetical protein